MPIKSQFLEKFKRIQELNDETYILHGDRIILEMLPKEELKTEGGLYIGTPDNMRNQTSQNRPAIGIVMTVGKGYINDDTGEEEQIPYSPGEVLFVSDIALKWLSEFPGLGATHQKLAITKSSDVHMSWPTIEAYEKFSGVLRGS